MLDMSNSIRQLTAASSTCSKKISNIEKISQDNGAAIASFSACQEKNNAKFEALDSAMDKIKQDISNIQVRNEHIVSNQAKIAAK